MTLFHYLFGLSGEAETFFAVLAILACGGIHAIIFIGLVIWLCVKEGKCENVQKRKKTNGGRNS